MDLIWHVLVLADLARHSRDVIVVVVNAGVVLQPDESCVCLPLVLGHPDFDLALDPTDVCIDLAFGQGKWVCRLED